jgi:hypothetical protein
MLNLVVRITTGLLRVTFPKHVTESCGKEQMKTAPHINAHFHS